MAIKPPSKTNSADELLTVKDVAIRDRCSEKTVRRAIDAGLLQVLRIGPSGRAIRISHEAHALYRMRWRAGQ